MLNCRGSGHGSGHVLRRAAQKAQVGPRPRVRPQRSSPPRRFPRPRDSCARRGVRNSGHRGAVGSPDPVSLLNQAVSDSFRINNPPCVGRWRVAERDPSATRPHSMNRPADRPDPTPALDINESAPFPSHCRRQAVSGLPASPRGRVGAGWYHGEGGPHPSTWRGPLRDARILRPHRLGSTRRELLTCRSVCCR